MEEQESDVLVTGGNGFIGRWLLAELTRQGRSVVALVRNAERRAPELGDFVAGLGGDPTRLRIVSGDIELAGLGLAEPLPRARHVYHLAARFEFGLAEDAARLAHLEGTLNVLRWMTAQPVPGRFILVGGYRMMSPSLLRGPPYVLPEAARRALYARHGRYEASKVESYLAARAFCEDRAVPFTGVHPSSVIGDSRTGLTTQRIGLAEPLEQLYEGRLPALVGNERTFVPVVAVDYLASFLASLLDNPATIGRDLAVLDERTPALPTLLRHAASHWGVPVPRMRLPVGLVRAAPSALTGTHREALQFLAEDRYDTEGAEAHARSVGLAAPDTEMTLRRWYDELVSTRFGKEPDADRGSMRDGLFVVGDPREADALLLHGLPWNAEVWKECADRIGRVTARLDLPGLGRSRPEAAQGPGWLEHLLEARQRPVVLVGQSLGAMHALRVALTRPAQICHLVLVSPSFLQARASLRMRLPPLVAWALARSTPASLAKQTLPTTLAHEPPALRSAIADLRRPGVAKRTARVLADASREDTRMQLRADLSKVQVPVTIVHGEHDPLLYEAPHAARAEVLSVRGAGHVPQLSHPEELAAILRRVIDQSTRAHRTSQRHALHEASDAAPLPKPETAA